MSDIFFEEVDGLGVSEQHIKRLMKLEQDEADKIIEVYRRVRNELRQKLAYWQAEGPDRFTAQRLRGVLLQIETALAKLETGLLSPMVSSGRSSSIFAIENLQDEIQKYEQHFTGAVMPIDLDALSYANRTETFLIEQYEASLERWSATVRERIERSLQDGVAMESTNEQMIKGLLGNWGSYEWELRRIVRTEVHSIYNHSKISGMRDVRSRQIPDLYKALLHPMDKRTAQDSIYLASLNPIMPIDKPFHYVWQPPGSSKKYPRTFMAPPDRPNDRAILIPYRKAWDEGEESLFPNVSAN